MIGKLQARAFFAPAVAAAGTAAAAALEAGAQRGTAAAALARGAFPDVAPHGQHRERDDDQQYNNRGEIHLVNWKQLEQLVKTTFSFSPRNRAAFIQPRTVVRGRTRSCFSKLFMLFSKTDSYDINDSGLYGY